MSKDSDYNQLLSGLIEVLAEPGEQAAPERCLPSESRLRIPDQIDVAAIRQKARLSQMAFANQIGVPVATIRNWEQGHRSPKGPARVLLALLDRNPRIVEETLGV